MTDEAITQTWSYAIPFGGGNFMAAISWSPVPMEDAENAMPVMKKALDMAYPNGVITFLTQAPGTDENTAAVYWMTGPCLTQEEAIERAREMSNYLDVCVKHGKTVVEARAAVEDAADAIAI